ncbi:hypothetical protein OIU74_015767 [Salix koriyanagi]|uniref:Uncharacterized protein n=1 Tax=Salix koriyanagi TaxID=2511006 RepID=A0A9Q0PN86_9ROSI|nr:hypothetical protein OIU74_015767 [Salix koriyanagi]
MAGNMYFLPLTPYALKLAPVTLSTRARPGIARVRTGPEFPGTSRDSLQRSGGWTLEIPAIERVGDGVCQQSSQVDDHSINSDVSVGCYQRWCLWAVNRLVKRPGTLTRTLKVRITNPNVRAPTRAGL